MWRRKGAGCLVRAGGGPSLLPLLPPGSSCSAATRPLIVSSSFEWRGQHRDYATVRTQHFERREARQDWTEITDKVWPRHPPKPIDYRNYVPPEEDDEEDTWQPAEDYPLPTFIKPYGEGGEVAPIVTPDPIPVRIDPRTGAYLGLGRRKKAIARVSLTPGQGRITVNGRTLIDYWPSVVERGMVLAPLVAIERPNTYNININVSGGGTKGQAEAAKMGIGRALQGLNNGFRPALKKAGCLERDQRMVESKKAGRVKARKRPQWSKR